MKNEQLQECFSYLGNGDYALNYLKRLAYIHRMPKLVAQQTLTDEMIDGNVLLSEDLRLYDNEDDNVEDDNEDDDNIFDEE